jgi:hypothetical protein
MAAVELWGSNWMDSRLLPPYRKSHQVFDRSSEVADLVKVAEDECDFRFTPKKWAKQYGAPVETVADCLNKFHNMYNFSDQDMLFTMALYHKYTESMEDFSLQHFHRGVSYGRDTYLSVTWQLDELLDEVLRVIFL